MAESKLTFLGHAAPLNTCMIQARTPERVKELAAGGRADGCDAFGFQFEKLESEYRDEKTVRTLFETMADKPVYCTNYRSGPKELTDDDRAEGLLFLRRCGAVLLDVMGDFFCPDPLQITYDGAAVDKQKRLIERLHEMGGEVLMSTHTFRYMPAEEILKIARAQIERGADIVKIVAAASNEAEELDNLRTTELLKEELPKPFLFLSAGSHNQLHRMAGPFCGCTMWLTVHEYDELATKAQPLTKAVSALKENFGYMIRR